ncbi:hybrid signal transduction histidine kinase G-like [Neocloeon triangulifer]|uniref:hybrid signal transduction histidine kinase G-like n=1 Tax=Neocloeon triangulifer TaxID=2078957 RepID=UPI00286EF5D0|nr:hybrid signal transduction histidine kinase G-like [Neocloeon triangulifer]
MPRQLVWFLWLLGAANCIRSTVFQPSPEVYNGTTTLEEQATAGRDDPDRTRLFNNNGYKRPLIIDSAIAGGGNLGAWRPPPPVSQPFFRPRPPNINVIPPPPTVYDPEGLDKYYQVGFQGGGFQPGFQGGAYPGDFVNPYPAYGGGGGDQCNIIGPLISLKKALFTVVKIAAVKLPVLALKFLTKAFAFIVLIGPLLLPLLLLFPVPVYGFANNGFNLNTGFGNNFANQNPNNVNNNPNNVNGNINNNNNLNRNPNNNNLGRLPNQNLNNNNLNVGRSIQKRALSVIAKGPCFPRAACEMGFWGYQTQVAWILDHVHESLKPTFPKLFNLWRVAYHQGGEGRDCPALYTCPTIDKVVVLAKQHNLLPEIV